jgi:glycine betaine catabolism B
VPMVLLYGARTMADAPFAGELQALDAAGDGFGLFFAFSRAPAVRPRDFSGRVNEAVIGAVLAALDGPPRATYVCGSNRFVETVTTHLVAMGQTPATIRTERFGGA